MRDEQVLNTVVRKFLLLLSAYLLHQAMQQRSASAGKNLCRQILNHHNNPIQCLKRPPCDVFINHRCIDTKRTISGLLFDHLSRLRLHPFLDSRNMRPGDKLFDSIDRAIRECKVGVAVFSPRYCESYFCLHELALLMETKRRVIPIFCDVKPSQLHVKNDGSCPPGELQRFARALEEAKYTVGLTFDSLEGDWSKFLTTAADAVVHNLIEVDGEETHKERKYFMKNYF